MEKADHERIANAANRVFGSEPGVLAVYQYGSSVRGIPAADLDLALLLETPIAPTRLEALASRLQMEGAPGGPPIDLRTLTGSPPRFQITVLKEGRVLFERDRRQRLTHEARIMGRWADFKPTWTRMRRRMLERWIHG